ncbi:hypothetical protein K2173_021368 [Erythroxylum novogranatense]|uniref:RING-type E3 ubiquitin transferase n=1 Tax=Erythroxylum novogranatense TaxID=1862640 RepID=A0AAV8TUU1_9ROSI|nr:hypothetical protein K2173_021368 [Erythroxylum novogranatense]
MGTDVTEVAGALPPSYSCQVHQSMCTELMKLIERIEEIYPRIEAARPGWASGIRLLCKLGGAIERAKQLLQYCSESSRLYLAYNGVVIVSRFERSRTSLEQCLGQIKDMVPVMLSTEISSIIDDLVAAKFSLDCSDEEAGKAIRDLLQHYTSSSDFVEYEIGTLQVATSRLCITNSVSLLMEKRSIKKLLHRVGDSDPKKNKNLRYLLHLLKKYGDLILNQATNPDSQPEGAFGHRILDDNFVYNNSARIGSCPARESTETQADKISTPEIPAEFRCPLSRRVMYDPVAIESGQTYERMWIQKWFDEGHDTCPKTNMKLTHHTLTPNTGRKDLISQWCENYGVPILDPNVQSYPSLDSSVNSIQSLGGITMNDLHIPLDISSISLGSPDENFHHTKIADGSGSMLMKKNDDLHGCKSDAIMNQTDVEILSVLTELNWESKCKIVEDAKSLLREDDKVCVSLSFENFVEPLISFLRDANDHHDATAQRAGFQLLLEFLRKNRSGISCLHEDALGILTSFLDTEVTEEALAILEVLSTHQDVSSKIKASGALVSILKILDCQSREFQEFAIRILRNLSSNIEVCSEIVSAQCTPKLVPFINDEHLASYCVVLLRNLCETEEGRVSVAETHGCIGSIAKLLESESPEDQEHAVAILLSLCSQRIQYCHLVMEAGVLTSLCNVTLNGNDKGKAIALELVRQLNDVEFVKDQKCSAPDMDATMESRHPVESKPPKTKSGFFTGIFKKSKYNSDGLTKKR